MTESSTGIPLADSLLAESDRLLRHERFAEAALVIARAFEVSLATCAGAVLLGVVSKRSAPVEIEMLRKRYMHAFGGMSLPALRNVVITLATRSVRPQTIPESLDFVEHSKRYGATTPAREHYAAIGDDGARRTMEELRDAPIVALCQSILHDRHQPGRDEVERQREAVANLARSLTAVFQTTPSEVVQ